MLLAGACAAMRTIAALIITMLSAVPLYAQAPPAAEPPPRWERKAEVSFVGTGGNTETQSAGLGASMVYRPGVWTTEAKARFVRSEANAVETARSLTADLRQGRALTPRVDVFGRYGFLSDEFSGIDARSTIDGGLGYKLLMGPAHTLRVDGGLGYSREDRVTGAELSFALANFGTAYKWQITGTTDLTDSAIYTRSLDEGEDWRFNNTIALTAALASIFSLKAAHELKHANAPVPGFEATDTLMSVALVAKW
jgi:putative salt-induced outer membrane protein